MKTDCELLGIRETRDLSRIRSAYRSIAKAVHPDIGTESEQLRNHVLFIRVTQAYERLLERLSSGDIRLGFGRDTRGGPGHGATGDTRGGPGHGATGDTRGGTTSGAQPPGESAVIPHKDPAYAYYKIATSYFSRIHPSYWRMDVKNALGLTSPARERELARIQDKTRELVSLFPKAYYYFSIVVHDYPQSMWVPDARDKMRQIEERTPLYEKIIASFTEHAKTVPRVNRMF
ncbi:MAG: DnaJ domain-containing protein [Spirochaetales bacterium]|nr:DnaJ domain-containing protein [Spirochaetales bacterium]